jgi:hypothetical protein
VRRSNIKDVSKGGEVEDMSGYGDDSDGRRSIWDASRNPVALEVAARWGGVKWLGVITLLYSGLMVWWLWLLNSDGTVLARPLSVCLIVSAVLAVVFGVISVVFSLKRTRRWARILSVTGRAVLAVSALQLVCLFVVHSRGSLAKAVVSFVVVLPFFVSMILAKARGVAVRDCGDVGDGADGDGESLG